MADKRFRYAFRVWAENLVELRRKLVESADPDAGLKQVLDLGLEDEPNTSYVRRIKRVLRLVAK
jgi:hypothetical protein